MSQSEYYEEKLYPLQDGVLNVVEDCGTPFYLTGGTALSRGYYNHRYSDDLDFFAEDDVDFHEHMSRILARLRDNNFIWDADSGIICFAQRKPHRVRGSIEARFRERPRPTLRHIQSHQFFSATGQRS